METAAANMKPELSPISDVPTWSIRALPDPVSKKKAMGVGVRAIANQPVRAK